MKRSKLVAGAMEGKWELLSDAVVGLHVEIKFPSGRRKWVMVEPG
jgi:hypothetical protein